MRTTTSGRMRRLAAFVAMACVIPTSYAQLLSWATVANNRDQVPGQSHKFFHSFNQPSVNSAGLVVFRGRGKAPQDCSACHGAALALALTPHEEQVAQGVFLRDMSAMTPVTVLAQRGTPVPHPNNTLYNGVPASFNEFPSFPRIDATSGLVVTRGQSQPAYSYLLADGVTETRIGAAGVYASSGNGLVMGASLLGAVVEGGSLTFPHFSVPGAPTGTRFDQMPSSPSAMGATKVGFKGNFTDPTDGIAKTGVFFRDVFADGGRSPVALVASSIGTVIPNQPAGGTAKFGATSGPSGASGYLAFTGWDIEEAPTLGGIYRAPLVPNPPLQLLVGIGDPVPGEPAGATFRQFGEGNSISEDGRYVAFWGTWGEAIRPKILQCPAEGMADRNEYCNALYPAGHAVAIPIHQGIFVADAAAGTVIPIAKTGEEGFSDFMYWVFSGHAPGTGEGGEDVIDETREPPRWRSSAFAALAGKAGELYGHPALPSPFQVAFKAARNGVDGIYLRKGGLAAPLETVVEAMSWQGQAIDPAAPPGSIVNSVGIERDGFRHENLVITASMLFETVDTSLHWAGLYLAKVPALRAGQLTVSPGSLAFGEVAVNTTSAPRQILVTNEWQVRVALTSMAITGPQYTLAGSDCPAELAPGSSCTISVVFSPTLVGPQDATLAVNGSTASVALTGTGRFGNSMLANVTSVISGYYTSLFGRPPDGEGLAYWTDEYMRLFAIGADPKEVFFALARAMLNSPEYIARNTSDGQFITDLYRAFMMREPDAGGITYWLAQMQAGLDRRVIISSFIFSAEYTGTILSAFGNYGTRPEFSAVTEMYRGFLNRLPDSEGFGFWLLQWQSAQCAGPAAVAAAAEAISLQFLGSAEFGARLQAEPAAGRARMIVAMLYDTFLRRGAEAEGFNFWVSQLESGAQSMDDIRRAFIASPEFQSRINVICAAGCIK